MTVIPHLLFDNGRLALQCAFEEKDLAKAVGGATWDKKSKRWTYAPRPEVLQNLRTVFPRLVVDNDAVDAVAVVAQREQEVRELKDTEDIDVQLPILATPYAHQRKAFQIGITLPAAAYLMEVGTGKTLAAIAAAGHRYKFDGVRRVIVLAPKSVVPNWPKEFKKFAAFPVRAEALEGSSEQKIRQMLRFDKDKDELQVIVLNYESAWRIEKTLMSWLRLAGDGGGMIICDEAHRIKSPSAEQSKAMHRLGRMVPYRLVLTGTPVTQGPLDWFSIYKFLDPNVFGTTFASFKARYAKMGGFQGKQVVGYENLAELVQKAHSIAYRVTKSECLDLPPETSVVRSLALSKDSRKVYDDLRKEAMTELESGGVITAQNVLTKLLRLQQVTGGFVSTETGTAYSLGTEKLDLLDDELDDLLDAGKKVVIFARFVPEIRAICARLEKRKVDYRYIMGEVSQADRGLAVDSFQADPSVKVFVAQLQTAGLGITLTAADTAIFYSMDFSMANHEQALGRIHRISQTVPVTYIYLLAENTVDEHVYKVLQDKKELATRVVDHWRDFF